MTPSADRSTSDRAASSRSPAGKTAAQRDAERVAAQRATVLRQAGDRARGMAGSLGAVHAGVNAALAEVDLAIAGTSTRVDAKVRGDLSGALAVIERLRHELAAAAADAARAAAAQRPPPTRH